MAYLYKQYCYSDLAEVVDSVQSSVYYDGLGLVQSVSGSLGVVTVGYLDSSFVLKTYSFSPPLCSQLGFDNSYTGLTTSDSIQLGSAVVLAFVLAYAIKILRRGL